MTTLFFDKAHTASIGATIFFVLFILLCYAMFGVMSYRFKIIVMTGKELIVIKPFRLQHKRFKFDSIKSLKWDLWEIHRMPDFRKLNILTTLGDRLSISDLEFVNYDSLEKWLIENTNVELNLDWKRNVEVRQAKFNRWLNLVAIIMLSFIFFVVLLSTPHRESVRLAVLITIPVMMWRLLVHLTRYQERITAARRKRR